MYSNAQHNSRYLLSVFGTRNGLLSPKIFTVVQSSDRHLWIGTEIGASRYNGYEFQNVQYTSAQEQIGKIVAIAEDSSGGIWLGGEAGLFYFMNGEAARCVFVQNYVAAVESLVTDKEGNLWIGEMHGLYRFSKQEIVQWQKAKKEFLSQRHKNITERIICLDADTAGNIYFGSFDGVFLLKKNASKASLVWKNNTPSNLVHFITALSPESVFINQYDGESVSLINGVEKYYAEPKSIGQKFFKRGYEIFRLTTGSVENHKGGDFLPFINFGKETNFAYDAICDAEGNFWVGTWEGLLRYRYTPFTVFHRQQQNHPETFSFLETGDGSLLFGGNRGSVSYKNGDNIIPSPVIKPMFSLAEVLGMYQHDDGSYLFGSGYEGIATLKNHKQVSYNEKTGLIDNHCNTFYRVNEHTVFGCSEKGVIVINPLAANAITGVYGFAKAYNRQPKLLGVFEPAANEFLFYSSQGLFRLKNGKLHLQDIKGLPAANLYITRMQQDKKQRIWIATQGKGLLQCSYDKEMLVMQRQFTVKDGLLSDEVLSVLTDKNDNIWVADYTSLSVLKETGNDGYFINFTERDGLPADYYQYLHLAQQKNGTIWALNSMNLFSFHPDSVVYNGIVPLLRFDSISLEKPGRKSFSTNNDSRLSYNQNSLSFSFTAISLSDPPKIKYAYRLLPGDTTWIETNQRKIYFNSLYPGNYTVQVRACNNSGLWSAPLQYSFQIQPPFWNTWWFYVLLGVLFLLGVYGLFKRRLKSVKDKAALQQQLTELESKALRAQMNPHFIFNSLNAIQELVVTKNEDAAYDYLSKFSKLLRLVLNNSEKPLIQLADEIAMLQLYLELESLRFRQSFSYEINVAESLDADGVLIPPLLLQPFLENAVWHGLMLKEGEKKLRLDITQQNRNLICILKDNGIGRKKAEEIKAQKLGAKHFDSKGLALSRQRINLIEIGGRKGNIEIIDLYENETPTGTQITIQLPLIHS